MRYSVDNVFLDRGSAEEYAALLRKKYKCDNRAVYVTSLNTDDAMEELRQLRNDIY